LELNAYSPSDSDLWYREFYFTSHDAANADMISKNPRKLQATDVLRQQPQDMDHYRMCILAPRRYATLRLFNEVSLSFRKDDLPQVPVVTSFIIRRHLRLWFPSDVLQLMWNKLPRLEYIFFELWRSWERRQQMRRDDGKYLYRHHYPI
jgi:hypothetical protein